ncbi:hypothetical protein E1263_33635 [Kribbella antibiotica]|uniref:WD40 repeat domain-containing protein n=1 Tax=Kribbella antibiotica TaxID=190195 RepID=A0A4R4YV62_9ACTN|nr:hypothetical protein [Kribbella antibiotica]TDD48209.1 hypothetical protein E1263_33635 [Kribbella antibiotica]
MNDTESRLRDYLDTKAATVPSNAQGPGLLAESTSRRPVWPILATAASVAAVLAITATVLTHVGPDKADPAGKPAPLTDAAPTVPYTLTTGINFKGTVHDGSRSVRLPKELRPVVARVAGGWLTEYYVQEAPSVDPHVGILKTDGTFKRLGPKRALGPRLSPDGRQVAMSTYPAGPTARILIYDISSGAEVHSIRPPSNMAGPVGWNPDGIWLDSGDPFSKDRLYLWKPGEAAARPIQVPSGFDGIETTPNSNIVVLTKRPERTAPTPGQSFATTKAEPPQEHCIQAGVLKGNAIEVQRESCSQGVRGPFPVLSPDGGKVLNVTDKLTIDVATGKTTKLDVPDQIENYPTPVFEDATKVLVVSKTEDGKGPQRLYRCEATTGECKLLQTEKNDQITLAER